MDEAINIIIIGSSNGTVEIVMIKVPKWDLIIGCIYRPPDTCHPKWNEALNEMRKAINDCQKDGKFLNVTLEGDLNFPDCDWADNTDDENGPF